MNQALVMDQRTDGGMCGVREEVCYLVIPHLYTIDFIISLAVSQLVDGIFSLSV